MRQPERWQDERWNGGRWRREPLGSRHFGLRRRRGTGGPLRRAPDDRLAGGVASGVAAWRGFSPSTVRIVFVLIALVTSGIGVALYVAAWLLIPRAGTEASIASRARSDSRGIALAAGAASLGILMLLIVGAIHDGWFISWAWPQVFSVAGLVLVWRNAPEDEQATLRRFAEPLENAAGTTTTRGVAVRLTLASFLLLAGVGVLLKAHANLALLGPLGGVALVIAAIVLFLGPWWLRIARDLVLERQARVRAEERADIAARIHDSVLQTLALIQRRADDPQKVVQLARLQERELRSWLFEGKAPDDTDVTLAAGVRQILEDVEGRYGIPVEAVTVGDCELDENLGALLAAAREATVNAAKWSGAEVISVFAEVEPAQVSIVVRDRGCGFDPAEVPADRKGLAESVHGRMSRRGGTATVSTAKGEGTKVTLTMPRAQASSTPSRA
ncbi:MAG: PspC domain-containing protein [Streptosporangiaceae bacterium]|nr:PspC domain-containing protein [Streptosporangiaceae bacterium]MBV9854949.1 PspC domain-containing protein [Streptosporangiaceae bacterium]